MGEYICKNCFTVFQSASPKCCGEVEEFSPEKHGAWLVGASNSWISVWKKWKDNPIFERVSQELANEGSYGAATCLNVFIERLVSAQQLRALDGAAMLPESGEYKVEWLDAETIRLTPRQ